MPVDMKGVNEILQSQVQSQEELAGLDRGFHVKYCRPDSSMLQSACGPMAAVGQLARNGSRWKLLGKNATSRTRDAIPNGPVEAKKTVPGSVLFLLGHRCNGLHFQSLAIHRFIFWLRLRRLRWRKLVHTSQNHRLYQCLHQFYWMMQRPSSVVFSEHSIK